MQGGEGSGDRAQGLLSPPGEEGRSKLGKKDDREREEEGRGPSLGGRNGRS